MMGPHDLRRRLFCILNFAFCIAVTSCAPKGPIALPSDPGTPLQDFAAIHAQLSSMCAGVRTMTAEIRLSGRAGDENVGGTVVAGFERPASMLLQGAGPLLVGTVFTLAARGGRATLVLHRDSAILRDEAPEAVLEAMAGVALAPADLQAVFTGCVLPAPRAVSGTLHANGMASIDIETIEAPRRTAKLFLRRSGSQWQLRSAQRDRWQIDYERWSGSFPQTVALIARQPSVNIRAALSQIETNTPIDPAAFTVDVKKDLTPITLEELREAGPLRGQ